MGIPIGASLFLFLLGILVTVIYVLVKKKTLDIEQKDVKRAFDPNKKRHFIPSRIQKENLYDPSWLENNSSTNEYVKIYYEVIRKMRQETNFRHIVAPYNKLEIANYVNNSINPKNGLWNYQIHHIDEIRISGTFFSTMPEYETSLAILVSTEEHFFLHYLIVMAKTTSPNGRILKEFGDLEIGLEYWVEMARKYCLKYGLKYDDKFLDLIFIEREMHEMLV
ncbi:hypothetical protein DA803_03050 [[Mycoplasma] phocae]|uniref:Uncharacterized protein n=1 Tax=[Mycoplasma] phocae TaxID=142651 RepID=A0A2Z5IRN7_9BACT|nr:hypothetical protein [[Mycoplasma] phocae]AXE61046.1 hypothetical protein DA803_03050 [[Mycoplasma] phocae]